MLLGIVVHFKNKYPKAKVEHSEDHINVFDQEGNLLVAVKRGGGGALVDAGASLGAADKYDLSPIPKNTRVFKLTAENKIVRDELHAERKVIADALADLHGGKVPCIPSLKAAGFEFEGDSVVLPAAKVLEGA